MVRIKIHRGTDQIGGTITEIYTENTHIFIDFGSELSVPEEVSSDRLMEEMIGKAECDAVLFSHYHGDHVGLMGKIPAQDVRGRRITLGIGKVARKILINIHKNLTGDFAVDREEHKKLLDLLNDKDNWIDFYNGKFFTIGDFTITTVKVDHSAYDAYMFILEAEGKTIVHTGDFRTHGRLGEALFPNLQELLKGKNADILITEGTMFERPGDKVISEEELEKKAINILKKPENKWAFLVCSSTNVESLASFHNAAMKLGRPFIVNCYVYEQILEYRKSAGRESDDLRFLKTYEFENMNIPNPRLGGLTQPEYMSKTGFVMLVGKSDSYKKRMEYFRDKNPLLIYSMWRGFVDDPNSDTYDKKLGQLVSDWRSKKLHTSGHASVKDVRTMIETVSPKIGVIPVHTTKKHDFDKLGLKNIKIITLNDGDVLEV